MREAVTKVSCDAPQCATPAEITHGELPDGWNAFEEKDYCPLHKISVTLDGVLKTRFEPRSA